MRKGAVTYERRARIKRQVGDLTDEARCSAQLQQLLRTQNVVAEFQFQIGDHRAKVSIAATLAVPVDRSLHMDGPRRHGRKRVGDRKFSIIVAMYAERHIELFQNLASDARNRVRQTPAVRITKYDALWPGDGGRAQGSKRILRISLIPVKEMLGIINEMWHTRRQIAHGVFYDFQVLFRTQTQCISNVQQPGFTEDRNNWSLRLQQSLNARVVIAGKSISSC